MSSKSFLVVLALMAIGAVGYIAITQHGKPKVAAIGVYHPNQGQTHITKGQAHPGYNSDPASSGWHYNDASAPTPWGVYTQEVPPEIFVHNEEHGGVIITYNPKLLPADQLKKLQTLFVPPYSDKNFIPSKAIVMPRAKDTHMLELAAWKVTYSMDSYSQTTIKNFYLQHVSQSPEATAGPFNTPINQTTQ